MYILLILMEEDGACFMWKGVLIHHKEVFDASIRIIWIGQGFVGRESIEQIRVLINILPDDFLQLVHHALHLRPGVHRIDSALGF